MVIALDYTSATTDSVPAAHGINPSTFEAFLKQNSSVLEAVVEDRENGRADFMDLPQDTETISKIKEFADAERDGIRNVVVIGIGGSALGPLALQSALSHPFHNLVKTPRLFIADNSDPVAVDALLDLVEGEDTLFNVITKSGSTPETMGIFAVVVARLKERLGKKYAERIIATTDPENGALRKLATAEGFRTFDIPPGVGGRFSVLTAVGLLPSALIGIDIESLCTGAAAMDERLRTDAPEENIAFVYAALMYLLDTQHGKSMNVFMPYSTGLRDLADWFRQLWAESLGKKFALDGSVVNVGQTPIAALGATDQHSQLQLYAEGPYDKVVTFVRLNEYGSACSIPRAFEGVEVLDYLADHTMAELISAEALGTEAALREEGRPSVTFELESQSPEAVGALMFVLEVATSYAGKFYKINPFDQPGVEAAKTAARALMGAPGFEERAKEILDSGKSGKKHRIE